MPPVITLPAVAAEARRSGSHTVFFVWHDFVTTRKEVWFDTTVAEFEKQLERIEAAGAQPVSLPDALRHLQTGAPLPAGAVVLCFDDNTVGIYEHAFPILSARGWPFAISAHTKYVGVKTGKDHCTWEQLQEIERGGGTVVSQTHTHPPDLRTLSDRDLRREMWESKLRHEDMLERTMPYLTYPSGKWDKRVALAAAEAGYRLALTEDHGAAETSPHLLALHRYSTHRRFDEAVQAAARNAKKAR